MSFDVAKAIGDLLEEVEVDIPWNRVEWDKGTEGHPLFGIIGRKNTNSNYYILIFNI